MRNRIQGIIVGVLIYAFVFGGITFAANLQKDIDVTYRDIKLIVDDKDITPRDASGNIVEPFIYDGTTYLPVRAVGEALGRSVSWDGETSTVHINEKQLRKVDMYDMELQKNPDEKYFYKKEEGSSKYIGFASPYTPQPMNTNVMSHFTDTLTYSLDGKAEEVSGTALPATGKYSSYSVIFMDAEKDIELYKVYIGSNDKAKEFKFNTNGVKTLEIEFYCHNGNFDEQAICALLNLAMYTYEK